MKAEDLIKVFNDPRFISGIYDYCDNWCERCAFTSRCLNYAIRQTDLDEVDPASHDLSHPKFLEKIKESFQTAKKLAVRDASSWGITAESLKLNDEQWEERMRQEEEARKRPLIKFAERYVVMVKTWFDREKNALDLAYNQSLGTGNDILPEELEDAVEVIIWYRFMPAVKLYRSVRFDDGFDDEEFRINETNGSVKVALIAMERSILAWSRMRDFFPEKAESIQPIIAHLEELRNWVDREFPDARSFIRPGFDEVTEHVM